MFLTDVMTIECVVDGRADPESGAEEKADTRDDRICLRGAGVDAKVNPTPASQNPKPETRDPATDQECFKCTADPEPR